MSAALAFGMAAWLAACRNGALQGLSAQSSSAASPPSAAARIATETARLQRALKDKPAADPDWQRARPEIERALGRVEEDLHAGRLYLGLEELGQARTSLRAVESTKEGLQVPQHGLSAFTPAWEKASAVLTARGQAARGDPWTGAPAAVQALAETAQAESRILLQASRAYAEVTSAGAGFYYLGEAEAAAETTAYCQALAPTMASSAPTFAGSAPPAPAGSPRGPSRRTAPLALRSVQPELGELSARTAAAYQPPRALRLHAAFIRLSATLKQAGELDATGLYAGALYQYLDAAQQFGMLEPAAPDAARRSRLRVTIAALQTRLRGSGRDDSIAELFLQRAAALAGGAEDPTPDPASWEKVAVIVEQVLPDYFAVIQASSPPRRAAASTIAVTLLRWPYT